jgi:hypothetical protein
MPTSVAYAPRPAFSLREMLGAVLNRIAAVAARNGDVEPFGL